MNATEKRLMFGRTLWPASCMVKPWLTTGLTTVARISSEIMALLLALSDLNVINREKLYIWLNPLASLLHGQTMVDHRVDHSGPHLIRDNGSPSCSFSSSSSSSSSSSYSHSSAFLIHHSLGIF